MALVYSAFDGVCGESLWHPVETSARAKMAAERVAARAFMLDWDAEIRRRVPAGLW